MFLQVECPCGEINSLSFLSKKERRQFEQEKDRVKEYLHKYGHFEEHPSSAMRDGRNALHSDHGIAVPVIPSAYAQVLRQFSPEVAEEYEKVQERHRNTQNLRHYANHPRDGSRVTLDYALPPWMEGFSRNHPVGYVIREGFEIQLHESSRSLENQYTVCLTAAMRDELLKRNLAQIDEPGERHSIYRFLACRMCPRCFKGPVSEDEVSVCACVY
jgi:hypothetical protein